MRSQAPAASRAQNLQPRSSSNLVCCSCSLGRSAAAASSSSSSSRQQHQLSTFVRGLQPPHVLQPIPGACIPISRRAPWSSLEPRQRLQPLAATGQPDQPGAPQQQGFLSSLYKSLRDFGLGKSSIAEGGLGLFTLAGGLVTLGLLAWVKGTALRKGRPYQATLEFPLACGITVGTPVRIRGVAVGSVLNVRPSLDKVDVLVEVNDIATVIPRNSVIEANQSGLIAEPLIDITPQLPLPTYTASPLELAACEEEEKIVCNQGHIKGQQGVALDDMVYIMTRMARQMEEEGIDKFFEAAQAATAAMEEATPLLEEAALLTKEITPLLQELREGGLMSNLDHLTEAAAGAAADIQSLQKAVLTDDNVRALRSAVLTLCKTLEHVESISADVSTFSRDTGVQQNLKTLITALSRIIEE